MPDAQRPRSRQRAGVSRAASVARPRRASARGRRLPSVIHRERPHPRLAWYAGLGLIAALEIIEWPVALVIAIGHEVAHRARTRALRELAEGIETGA